MGIVLSKMGERGSKNYFQPCLDENMLAARKPSTESDYFEIRIIPEIDDEGNPVPLIQSLGQAGAVYSNFQIEPVVVNAGANQRFSGLGKSTRMEDDEADTVFTRLFINARAAEKRGEIPSELEDEVEGYLKGGMKAPLRTGQSLAMVQCIVISLNGKKLDRPLTKQAVFLTSTAVEDLDVKLRKLYEEDGVDMASPAEGRIIRFTPEKMRGNPKIKIFGVTIRDAAPIKVEDCRKLWVPWEKAMRRHSFEDLLSAAVNCYSPEFVRWVFPMDYQRVFGEARTVTAAPAETKVVEEKAPVKEPEPEEADTSMRLDLDAPPVLDDSEEGAEEEGASDEPESSVAADAGEEGNASSPQDAEAMSKEYEDLLDGL